MDTNDNGVAADMTAREMTANDAYAYPGPRFTENGIASGHGMGMTLRDWFAGQAAASVCGGLASAQISTGKGDAAVIAAAAYMMADAMLAARAEDRR